MKVTHRTYLGVGDENSLATAAQPAAFVEFDSEGLAKTRERRNIRSINGTRHIKKSVTLAELTGGPFSFPAMPGEFLLRMLKRGIGSSYAKTTLTAGVYQYVFVAGPISQGSCTFQVATDTNDTTGTFNYTGSHVNALNFALASNDLLQVEADIMGVDETLANTIATAVHTASNPYTFVDCVISIGDTSAAATQTALTAWNCNVNNNYLDNNSIDGTATRTDLEPGDQDITGEIARFYSNNDLYTRTINSTQTYLKVLFDNGQTIAAAHTHQLNFELFNIKIDPPNRGQIAGANQLISESHPYVAIFNDASTTALRITVVSDVSTIS